MDITELVGSGRDLTPLQMSIRAVAIFIIALVLLRFSGRRSYGMKTPFDNVIFILLGAILSRAVTGVSPFFSTIAATTSIVLLYRLFAWIGLHSGAFGKIVKGDSKILYKDGELMRENMNSCFISERDLMEGIRMNSNIDSLDKIKEVYIERCGRISVIKKEE